MADEEIRLRNYELSIRDRAPIAAEFEECTQLFQSLCSAFEANPQNWNTCHAVLSDDRDVLAAWGADVGATSYVLDHALRKALRLQEHVHQLLQDLSSELQKILDFVQVTELPLLSPFSPPVASTAGQGYFDLAIRPKSTFQGLHGRGKQLRSPAAFETNDSMESMLDFITATTRRLQRLVPTLRDPSLVDMTADKTPPNADREDVAIVTDLFPQAPVILIQRLGRASWKRRQYLKDVRAMLQKQTNPNRSQLYIGGRQADQEPKPNSKPWGKIFPPSKLQMTDISDHRKASFTRYRADSETASLTGTSASHRGPPTSTAGTSVADSTEFVKSNLFPVPRPPIPLEDGKRFQCSYCAHHLLVGKDIRTEDDWTQHVFSDLEPYMCTFANDLVTCMGVDKTYGSRQKWIAHELDAHRSTMVWYCQRCSEEFITDEAFESHLLASHYHRLERDQLSLMATLCKRSSVRPLFNDPCPLCKAAFFSADAFFAHLSAHFEQIALASIQSQTPVDEPMPTSPIFSMTSFEYGHKSNFNAIEYFVSEQHRRWVAQRREDPGGKNQGLQDMQTAIAGDLLSHEQHISPASVTSPRAGARPAMAERAASYSYLEQARHLRNAMTGAIDQTVPSVTASPQHICVRTMAPARHQDFVGRLNDMAKVHHELVQKGHMCIVNGVGGLGKSALVVEYTYLFESAYDYIFWIQAETPMRCAEAYSQIAITCVPYATPSQGQERLVALSREFLEQTSKRWLLVFDNVEHWRSLQSFLPDNMSSTCGSVLVTSNKVDISSFTPDMRYTIINLGTLGLDESRKLLLSATSVRFDGDIKDHPEYKLAGDVARMAERLPLALSLIAGYILVSELTLTEFVELWNERPVKIPSEAVSTDQRDEEPEVSMENVWNIGLREVPTEARELLNILAFFDSDNVQKDLLVGPHTDPLLEILHSSGVTRYKRMIKELSRRNLIQVDNRDAGEVLSIHRKLQTKILQDLNKNGAQRERAFTQAFLLIRTRFPAASPIQVPEPEKWPICRRYLLHVLSLRRLVINKAVEIVPSVDLARLFSDGGIDLWERGLTQEGLELLHSAENILDQVGSAENLLRANIHVIISLLIQDSGLTRIGESKARITDALQIRRQYRETTPPHLYTRNDEILLYNAVSDFGCVLLQYNKYEEARPLFAECFARYQSWDVPEKIPYEYAKYYHHMAFCRMYAGDHAEAVRLAQEGLHWVTVATGQSAATNRWKFDLACLTLQSGDTEEAMKLHAEILESRIKLHGKYAFLTLQSYYALGACSDFQGALPAAETYLRTVISLASNRNSTFPEAALSRTRFHLSQVLIKQKKNLEESQKLAEGARQFLAQDHPLKKLEGVPEEHELILFDHLQPVLDGRFTSPWLLKYLRLSACE